MPAASSPPTWPKNWLRERTTRTGVSLIGLPPILGLAVGRSGRRLWHPNIGGALASYRGLQGAPSAAAPGLRPRRPPRATSNPRYGAGARTRYAWCAPPAVVAAGGPPRATSDPRYGREGAPVGQSFCNRR